MKLLNNIIYLGIILLIGSQIANKFSYNISIKNDKRWITFIQHPIKYITNRGKLE